MKIAKERIAKQTGIKDLPNPLRTKSTFSALRFSISPFLRFSVPLHFRLLLNIPVPVP
ncbi:hypothetical protein PAXRUDRAFT_20844 [Paxillus rubicundulus Ve08.2h10]|uniref:Uncharacterized protein n=1 Tax=Paxillus rubicundulus Ve08.2h10 TaxID=930991 RepID=A0A0D0D0Y5_9AGAM|nr:hypothetical protein PAXRUDRAFT_20844 [Paxillus rubicundulus Ve08.2h10]